MPLRELQNFQGQPGRHFYGTSHYLLDDLIHELMAIADRLFSGSPYILTTYST